MCAISPAGSMLSQGLEELDFLRGACSAAQVCVFRGDLPGGGGGEWKHGLAVYAQSVPLTQCCHKSRRGVLTLCEGHASLPRHVHENCRKLHPRDPPAPITSSITPCSECFTLHAFA